MEYVNFCAKCGKQTENPVTCNHCRDKYCEKCIEGHKHGVTESK